MTEGGYAVGEIANSGENIIALMALEEISSYAVIDTPPTPPPSGKERSMMTWRLTRVLFLGCHQGTVLSPG